jgi:hypothetical protein
MTLGRSLQVVGAILELGGLGTVAWGISDTRRRFTDRPSIKDQSVDFLKRTAKRATARFHRKPRQIVVGVGAAAGRIHFGGGHVYPTAKLADQAGTTVEERLDQIRTMVNQHAEKLTALERRIDEEADSRKEADEAADRQRRVTEEGLRKLIADAAAGGLRLETVGVLLFAAGLVIGVVGSLVG